MASAQPLAVVERLLGDDYVHDQIGEAAAAARDAYRRARKLPTEQAVMDRGVYERVRRAAEGLAEAARRALDQPPPKPRRGRRFSAAIVLIATGAAVMWAANADRRSRTSADVPATVEAAPSAAAAESAAP